jgi:hypothetical protein
MIETHKSTQLELIDVYSKNEIKHVNAAHGQNMQFINVQADDTVDNVSTGCVLNNSELSLY